MEIKLEFDPNTLKVIQPDSDRCVELNELEKEVFDKIIHMISNDVDISKIRLEKRSDAYTSVVFGNLNDFMRFKFTDKTKWISLRLPREIAKENMDNPLFDAQKNKRQLHWKSKLKSVDEIELLKPFIISSCYECDFE